VCVRACVSVCVCSSRESALGMSCYPVENLVQDNIAQWKNLHIQIEQEAERKSVNVCVCVCACVCVCVCVCAKWRNRE